MALPKISSIEIPILQELAATGGGGGDNVRFLYERLAAYFPQVSESEMSEIRNGENKNWKSAIQRAGKTLEEKNLIGRSGGFWTITEKGKRQVEVETSGFSVDKNESVSPTHSDIQRMVVEIGESLSFFAATEFEYYDVVWRETPKNPRLSHVFEVQSKGNLDSAFAKLKRAYEAQRTKLFLIISTERDLNRAVQSLSREFHDIEDTVTILTFSQIETAHRNISGIREIIGKFLLK